jgi:hypothetical protein
MSKHFLSKVLFISIFCAFSFPVFSMLLSSKHTQYPIGPDPTLTPGKLCDAPQSYRYPEKIAYCDRDVSYEIKENLITSYDVQLGYAIESMNRQDFKIDHYIPLCAGGSNDSSNLWPQHKSIYEITDPIEPLICKKMALGKLNQALAVELIMTVKNDLSQASMILQRLQRL